MGAMSDLEFGVTIATSHAILVRLAGNFMVNRLIGKAVSKEKRATVGSLLPMGLILVLSTKSKLINFCSC